MNGAERITAERKRQMEKEGWTAEKDDLENDRDQLAMAAAYYAVPEIVRLALKNTHVRLWPWFPKDLKLTPANRIRELEKAGALIAAEIDRLLRLEKKI